MVAGPGYRLVADLAPCIKKGGAGFCARQGWTGGGGVWGWSTRATFGGSDRGEGWRQVAEGASRGEAASSLVLEC